MARGRTFIVVFVCSLGFVLPVTAPVSVAHGGDRALFGPPMGDTVQVMSFNLRFASHRIPHSWRQRRPVMAELLNAEQPTVIGTQEGLFGQLRDIERDLPDRYAWIGQGRKGGNKDEFVAIFFDAARLKLLASGDFWLSDTPAVPGSRTWGNETVRMASWAHFLDRRTGKEFAVVNTHFDNHSGQSRTRAAALVRERVAAFGLPVVLTGDFNAAAERSAAYDVLVRDNGMTDTWLTSAEHRSPPYATWHGYRPLQPGGPRIDWILTWGAVTTHAVGLNTTRHRGRFPSDHLPLQALLTFG